MQSFKDKTFPPSWIVINSISVIFVSRPSHIGVVGRKTSIQINITNKKKKRKTKLIERNGNVVALSLGD